MTFTYLIIRIACGAVAPFDRQNPGRQPLFLSYSDISPLESD